MVRVVLQPGIVEFTASAGAEVEEPLNSKRGSNVVHVVQTALSEPQKTTSRAGAVPSNMALECSKSLLGTTRTTCVATPSP